MLLGDVSPNGCSVVRITSTRSSAHQARPRCARIHRRPPRSAPRLRTRWTPSPCGRLSRPRTTTGPPPHPASVSRRRTFPSAIFRRRGGTDRMVPTFTRQPFDGVGAQLCPCSSATATPQTFTVASRSVTLSDKEFPESGMRCSAAVIHQVQAAGSLEELSAAGSSTYAFPSRLPDAGHLAVLTSSVVVRAAFHRPLRPEVQAALSFDMPAATGIRRCSLITARLMSASWRSMSAHQTWSGRSIVSSRSRYG